MSVFVDANIFVRLLTGDDPEKAARSLALFQRAQRGALTLSVRRGNTSQAGIAIRLGTTRRMTMRAISSMTSKGQVTIPKAIRDELDLQPHDKIAFVMVEGHVTLRKAYPSLRDLMGSLPASEVPMEEWDEVVQDDIAQHYIEHLAKERA